MQGAFESGSVTNYNGANGVLEKLLTFIAGTEVTGEVIATAANVNTTLAQTPVAMGRLKVDYTISAVAYEAYDDGNGNITGDLITTGTINYTSGAIVINFTGTPTGNVTADYLYGTEGKDWRILMEENSKNQHNADAFSPGSTCKQVILQNTGDSGQEQVLIGIREFQYPAGSGYGWDLNGYREYAEGQVWNANMGETGLSSYSGTWERWNQLPMMPMIDDTMYYWFYSDRNRIIVVLKISSNYDSIYLGHGRRYGSPSEYPCPLVVSGSSTAYFIYSSTDSTRRFAVDNSNDGSSEATLLIVEPDGSYNNSILDTNYRPRHIPGNDKGFNTVATFTPAGCVISTPCYISDGRLTEGFLPRCLMDLYGIYYLACDGIQSEDTVTINASRCRIFQNIHRVTHTDFMAVEENTTSTTTTTTT